MSAVQPKTFRGRSRAEVAAKVRLEMGPEAIVVREREGLMGGVGGFFQHRCVEVDVVPAGTVVEDAAEPVVEARTTSDDQRRRFLEQLEAAQAVAEAALAERAAPGEQPGRDEDATEPAAEPAAAVPDSEPAAAEPFTIEGDGARFEPSELIAGALRERPEPHAELRPAVARENAAALAAMFSPDLRPAIEEPAAEPAGAAVALAEPEPASEPVVEPAPVPVPRREAESLPATGLWPAEALPLHQGLVGHGVSGELAVEIVDQAVTHLLPFSSPAQLRPLVVEALARRIPVQPLRGSGGRVIGFVGPGGAGKTRSVARLAHTYAERMGLPVACVALRPEDSGAELAQLLAPYGVPVHAHDDAAEARERIRSLRRESLVLLDTPGVSPRAQAELRVLAAELAQLALDECHLAMPATIRAEVGRELIRTTRRKLGVGAMALTHADETDQLGTVVGLAIESELPLSYVGRGTIVSGGLQPALAGELATALVS